MGTIGIMDPLGREIRLKETMKEITEYYVKTLNLKKHLDYVKSKKAAFSESNPFENALEYMELLKTEKELKAALKEAEEKFISAKQEHTKLLTWKKKFEKSCDKKEKQRDFEIYSDVTDFLYDCTENFFHKAEKSEGETEFIPTNEIKTTGDLRRLLDYIKAEYSHIADEFSARGKSYYIKISSFPLLHPFFIYTVFYLLIRTEATIYFDAEDADSYDNMSGIALAIAEGYPEAEILYRGLGEAIEDGKRIDHVIDMGDFCNLHTRLSDYEIDNVSLHYPGAVTILVDYSAEDIPAADNEKLAVLGRNCFEALVDYDAYRGADNKAEECSYGFDFGDLFWGVGAAVRMFKDIKIKHDKGVIYVFTDKSTEEMGLTEYTDKYCSLIRSENLDINRHYYDFTQLFN